MEQLNPDLIRLIYGHLDDVDLAKACMINPDFSNKICNNTFWRNKLIEEFGFSDSDIIKYKQNNTYWAYYSYLKEQLGQGIILYNGGLLNRIDLIRVGLDRGADIRGSNRSQRAELSTPLTVALQNNNIEVYKYLLSRGAITNIEEAVYEIRDALDMLENAPSIISRVKTIKIIYDLLLPAVYKYINNQRFWGTSADRLEVMNNDPNSEGQLNDIYNRRIGELRKLSK